VLNLIWLILLVGSLAVAVLTGNVKALVTGAVESAVSAFTLALGLTGVMALWLGIMRIAKDSGLTEQLTRLMTPVMRRLFPGVPENHPAQAAMAMNITANMFGLSNAATPLGIRAMEDLDTLNPHKGTATDDMCMFLAVNTSSVQLIPAGAIALLAAGGSSDPTAIVLPALLATCCSTAAGIVAAKLLSRASRFRKDDAGGGET
jgi:spore maturation protein A